MPPKKPRLSSPPPPAAEDLISLLPDAVISHILSFLPTLDSVRTRTLSTRWKHLFALVPILDFKYTTNPTNSIQTFLSFVDSVFTAHTANSIHTFKLQSDAKIQDSTKLSSWISQSVLGGLRSLDLSVFLTLPMTLPGSLFNCRTLTELSICANFVFDVPEDVRLPNVKRIWLFHASFSSSVSADRFFRNCPVLEYLLLSLTYTGEIQVICISVPSLKRLEVIPNREDKYALFLNVPNLEYLQYIGFAPYGLYAAVNGLKSLNEAFIAFPAHFHQLYDGLEKLLNAVSHVRTLRICTWTLEALRRSGLPIPRLNNVTRLEIKVVSSYDSGFILNLLAYTPNLEAFVIDYGNIDEDAMIHHDQSFPEEVPSCVSRHLKEVQIDGFCMMDYEYKLVGYFLKNAEILDTVKIVCNESVERQLEMSVDLLTLPRYSRTCRIELA